MKNGKPKRNILMVLLYIVLILPFFKITYFTYKYPSLNTLYNVLLFFTLAISLILIFRKKKYSSIINYVLLFFVVLIFSTYINSADITTAIISSVKSLTMCLLFDYAIRNDKLNFIRGCNIYLTIIILINFITILLYSKGMYVSGIDNYTSNWFLGYKNMHILYILPSILFSVMDTYLNKDKLKLSNYVYILICLASTIMSNSGTAIIGVFLVAFFMIFRNVFSNNKIFNIKNYFIFNLVSFFSLVIFRIQNLFKFLIVDILKRDITLTNRIYIWDYVVEFIKNKPLFGYGIEFSTERYYKTYFYRSLHAHNQILEIMYKTGIVGLLLFAILFLVASRRIKNISKDNLIVKTVSIVTLSFLIVMLTEAYSFEYFMYLFILIYDLEYLIRNGSDTNEN